MDVACGSVLSLLRPLLTVVCSRALRRAGDVGEFKEGDMQKPFEDAVKSLKVGVLRVILPCVLARHSTLKSRSYV